MADPAHRPRVALGRHGMFAHVPGQVVVRGASAKDDLAQFADQYGFAVDFDQEQHADFHCCGGSIDVPAAVEYLRSKGRVAQPNHVMFAHPFRGNPYAGNPYAGNPYAGNPYAGNPYAGNPYAGNPYAGNPYAGSPYAGNGMAMSVPVGGQRPPRSNVAPAPGRELPVRPLEGPGDHPVVVVLDTGLPEARPDLLADTERITGDLDAPDGPLIDWEGVEHPPDGVLDPYAGHGVFITGLIEQIAPGCRIHVGRVVGPLGDADEVTVANALHRLATENAVPGVLGPPDIVLLSLGAPTLDSPFLLRAALAECRSAGIQVVASAGNSASPLPHWPAASDGVLAVGALGPGGPAVFTNHGPWVDCCAPGVDLVSSFFRDVTGPMAEVNTIDVDDFDQWARWSGTSFAAPVVVGALAREMVAGNVEAADAVERLVRAPHLHRLPGLGTVINV